MLGRRLPDDSDIREAEPGDYFFVTWDKGAGPRTLWFRDPLGEAGRVSKHRVEEHEDGTVTVSPSIAPAPGQAGWHGFLERGVWREA